MILSSQVYNSPYSFPPKIQTSIIQLYDTVCFRIFISHLSKVSAKTRSESARPCVPSPPQNPALQRPTKSAGEGPSKCERRSDTMKAMPAKNPPKGAADIELGRACFLSFHRRCLVERKSERERKSASLARHSWPTKLNRSSACGTSCAPDHVRPGESRPDVREPERERLPIRSSCLSSPFAGKSCSSEDAGAHFLPGHGALVARGRAARLYALLARPCAERAHCCRRLHAAG